jgi:hypothetical protein
VKLNSLEGYSKVKVYSGSDCDGDAATDSLTEGECVDVEVGSVSFN